MTIFQTYIMTLKKFSYRGRASRKEFWTFSLINLSIYILTLWLANSNQNENLQIFGVLTFFIFLLITFIQSFTLSIRRLHDTNRSGWWLLISFIPYIGNLVLLIFYCLKSNTGNNRFGAAPYTQQNTPKKKEEELDALGNTKRHLEDTDQNKLIF